VKLGVDRVTRPDLDQPAGLVQPRVEPVKGPHRRAAGDQAPEVIDAAVTRAHEALGGGHEADRAAEVHAPRGERDVVVVLILGLGIDLGVTEADVGDRVAGLADPLDDRDHLRRIGRLNEIAGLADRLPVKRLAAEDRPQGKAKHRQREGGGGDEARPLSDPVHETTTRHRLALEGARHPPVCGVLGFASFFVPICHLRLSQRRLSRF
jgi:hypothetical protein